MTYRGSIAPAIALRQPAPASKEYDGDHSVEAIIRQIYAELNEMLQFEASARASWLVEKVVDRFCPKGSFESDVAPKDVSWLLWEEINAGRILIDKHGGLNRGTAAAV